MQFRSSLRAACLPLCWCALAALGPRALAAQGGNVDIISGTMTDAAGKPIANAVVEALSIETDVTRRATTKADERYITFFNDGGGEYRVTARAIGHGPFIQNVSRQADDDRIDLDIRLGTSAVKLNDLVANTNRRPNLAVNDRATPGETSLFITGDQAMRLPIDATDLAALAALAPA